MAFLETDRKTEALDREEKVREQSRVPRHRARDERGTVFELAVTGFRVEDSARTRENSPR
jgi:hypothetical protein